MNGPPSEKGRPRKDGQETLSTSQKNTRPNGAGQEHTSGDSGHQQPERQRRRHHYFIFPLVALRYGETAKQQQAAITCWCCYYRGLELCEGTDEEDILEAFPSLRDTNGFLDDADISPTDSLALELGLFLHSRTCQYAGPLIRSAKQLDTFRRNTGSKTSVCIRTDILDDWGSGKIADRDFRVICSLYSILGRDVPYKRVTREFIVARALGYDKSSDVTKTALRNRQDKQKPLTESQVKWTLARLEERGFFVRVTLGRRSYYSHRLSATELSDMLYRKEEAKVRKSSAANRVRDRALHAKISTLKQQVLRADPW